MVGSYFQESKEFENQLTECQRLLLNVDDPILRKFLLLELPFKLEVQVSHLRFVTQQTRTGQMLAQSRN
jgi:hypothetical protein